jgi:hypothetical protein
MKPMPRAINAVHSMIREQQQKLQMDDVAQIPTLGLREDRRALR